MSINKDLKREVRVETGMRFGRATPTDLEVKEAVRQVLELKLKQKRQQLDAGIKEAAINGIVDDLLGLGPLEPFLSDNTITEYVGVATPVVTPIALGVKNKKLAAKP